MPRPDLQSAVRCKRLGGIVLLGGWLLMHPPPGDKDMPNIPLSQWRQFSAHDTAKDCEAARSTLVRAASAEAMRLVAADEGKDSKEVDPTPYAIFGARMLSKCVPAESIYPRKK
jgi:hypothetical protein